ncbi:unnamed protein product, partial [marine sediment metagenome]
MPISHKITSCTPNQIGSKPQTVTKRGNVTGRVIIIIAKVSMRHPKIRYITTTASQICSGSNPEAATRFAI